ncbi:NusA-like transcription termination signal-binding factor [Candidatus Woesearchaeota archaeon]|nr:NusA-like transcription termination signal-binding factor [Candidatus Woesearchaeota archaeon]
MQKIKYDIALMKYMSLFETLTHANVKDCFVDVHNTLVFLVEENNIGRAIGKKGANVRRLETMLNRKIKIVEFNSNVLTFMRNLVMPLRLEMAQEGNTVLLSCKDTKTAGLLIGRNAQNLRNYEEIVQRYFPQTTLKVQKN